MSVNTYTNFTGYLFQITSRVLIFYDCANKLIYKLWRSHINPSNFKYIKYILWKTHCEIVLLNVNASGFYS